MDVVPPTEVGWCQHGVGWCQHGIMSNTMYRNILSRQMASKIKVFLRNYSLGISLKKNAQ